MAENLSGKVLIDLANPLDFSKGMPPSLSICNTDSLGERIKAAFPDAGVVKTLNTMTAPLMHNPGSVGNGDHTVFMSGNDRAAKVVALGRGGCRVFEIDLTGGRTYTFKNVYHKPFRPDVRTVAFHAALL